MTLEQLGFDGVKLDNYRIYYIRVKPDRRYNDYIEFHLPYKEIDTNLELMDMVLLEAIYTKAKELFE